MLKDLSTTVAEAEKEVKKRILERDTKGHQNPENEGEAEAKDVTEDDEDEFIE